MFFEPPPVAVPCQDKPVHLWVERAPNRPENRPFRPLFGSYVAGLGDVDGDRVPDFLVADARPCRSHRWELDMPSDADAWIFSGRDGRTIGHVKGPQDERGGFSAAALGDIDGDGGSDFVVGWGEGLAGQSGLVEVFSGRRTALLKSFDGACGFGRHVANSGDVDGDGIDDVIVSGAEHPNVAGSMLATIFSSRTGEVSSRIPATEPGETLVSAPLAVGREFTGDGPGVILATVTDAEPRARIRRMRIRDRAVQSSTLLPSPPPTISYLTDRFHLARWTIAGRAGEPACLVAQADGTVWQVSMRTSETTLLRPDDPSFYVYGVGMAVGGSIDGDESPDYWIGSLAEFAGESMIHAISGVDGRALYSRGSFEDMCKLDIWPQATTLAAVGDVDADGVGDVLMGTGRVYSMQQGAAFLLSGKSGNVIFGLQRTRDGVRVVKP